MNTRRSYPQTTKSVAFLFFLLTPGVNAISILKTWPSHPVLRDYLQPDREVLSVWVEEFVSFRNSQLYKASYRGANRDERRDGSTNDDSAPIRKNGRS